MSRPAAAVEPVPAAAPPADPALASAEAELPPLLHALHNVHIDARPALDAAVAQPAAAHPNSEEWNMRLRSALQRAPHLEPEMPSAAPERDLLARPPGSPELDPGQRLMSTCDEYSSFEEERMKWEEERARPGEQMQLPAGENAMQNVFPSVASKHHAEMLQQAIRQLQSESEPVQLEGLIQLTQLISSTKEQILQFPAIIRLLHQLLSAHHNPVLQVRRVAEQCVERIVFPRRLTSSMCMCLHVIVLDDVSYEPPGLSVHACGCALSSALRELPILCPLPSLCVSCVFAFYLS
jgi:hypothetical protein